MMRYALDAVAVVVAALYARREIRLAVEEVRRDRRR